jgi:hypothetical protein
MSSSRKPFQNSPNFVSRAQAPPLLFIGKTSAVAPALQATAPVAVAAATTAAATMAAASAMATSGVTPAATAAVLTVVAAAKAAAATAVTAAETVAVTAAVATASTAAATVATAALAVTSVVAALALAAPRRRRLAVGVPDGGRSTLFARSGVRRIGRWTEPMLLAIAETNMVATAVVEGSGSGEENAP